MPLAETFESPDRTRHRHIGAVKLGLLHMHRYPWLLIDSWWGQIQLRIGAREDCALAV
jgi:hypothetical protein